MKLTLKSARTEVTGRLGPLCIACGNTRSFWVQCPEGERLCTVSDLPDGEIRVMACGRCRSRNSIVVAHLD